MPCAFMGTLIYILYLATLASLVRTDTVEPGSSDAILCLTNTVQGGQSSVASRQYTHAGGYDVCIKYQAFTGTAWTWVYGATSSAGCAHRIQQSEQYRHVQCCMQDNCNTPDAVLDPTTQVAPPSAPTPQQLTFDQPYHLTPARRARKLLLNEQTSISARHRGTLSCYRTAPTTAQPAASFPAVAPKTYLKSESAELCSRYSYRCSAGDRACSAADIKAAVWKWMYAPISAATCMELRAYSRRPDAAIKHVKCCSGTLCNRPDGKLDPDTKVLHTSKASAASDKHQRIRSTSLQRQQSLTTAAAADAAIKRGTALHIHTSNPAAAEGQQMKRLACYTSLPRSEYAAAADHEAAGASSSASAAVMSRVYRTMQDGVCSRYQVKCSAGRSSACTAADISSSSWVWQYRALTESACSRLQEYAATAAAAATAGGKGGKVGFRNVLCCSSDNCNTPDPNLDGGTQVQANKAPAAAAASAADIEVRPAVTASNSTVDASAGL